MEQTNYDYCLVCFLFANLSQAQAHYSVHKYCNIHNQIVIYHDSQIT